MRMKIEFPYFDKEDKKKTVSVSFEPKQCPNPLKPLNDKTLVAEPGHSNRGYTMQTANWFVINEQGEKVELLHERAYFPYDWTKEPSVEYWVEGNFKGAFAAAREINDRGCDVSKWNCQQHWYQEEVGYFLQTHDFSEALKYLGYEYVGDKATLPTLMPVEK